MSGWRIGCALLCLALVVSPLAPARTPGEVPIGGVLREATLQGLNGPPRRLAEYRGRPLLINVWASWCGPCIQEMASLERLAWREDRLAFSVIGISTDDYPEKALAFLNRSNATIRHFIDHDLQMENMLGASTIPLTVLVDANGRVLDKIYGAREWDSPESMRLISKAFHSQRQVPRNDLLISITNLVLTGIERYTRKRCISIRTEGAAGRMQVAKWGNSLAVRLPAAVVEALKLKEGEEIEIHVAGARVLEIARKPTARELLARLRKYRGRIPQDFKFDRLEAHERG